MAKRKTIGKLKLNLSDEQKKILRGFYETGKDHGYSLPKVSKGLAKNLTRLIFGVGLVFSLNSCKTQKYTSSRDIYFPPTNYILKLNFASENSKFSSNNYGFYHFSYDDILGKVKE